MSKYKTEKIGLQAAKNRFFGFEKTLHRFFGFDKNWVGNLQATGMSRPP